MDKNDTLFQSLLHKQGITDFMPINFDRNRINNYILGDQIKLNDKYIRLDQLYGYIKDSTFHICDINFTEFPLTEIHIEENGLFHIGIKDNSYWYPCGDFSMSIVVVQNNGKILYRNPPHFFYIGTNEFLIDTPIYFNNFEEGIVFDVKKKTFIIPKTYSTIGGYNAKKDIILPKLQKKKFIENGKQTNKLHYLFSIIKEYINPVHTLSYFINNKNNSITLFESSRHGTDKIVLNPLYIWHAGNNLYTISIKLLNKYDINDNIILEKKHGNKVLFEILVESGSSFNVPSKSMLDVYDLHTKSDVNKFIENLQVIPTKNSLLIASEKINSYYVILVRDNGVITMCDKISCFSIYFTENNILHIRQFDYPIVKYADINGNTLCYAKSDYKCDFQIFKRILGQPTRFNSLEINAQKKNISQKIQKREGYDILEGVINLETGSVIVPPIFSNIQTYRAEEPFTTPDEPFNSCEKDDLEKKENDNVEDTDYNELSYQYDDEYYEYEFEERSKFISIVQIDNYINGETKSYYGVYIDSELIIPIKYSNISFLKYKKPKSEWSINIDAEDEEKFFDNHFSKYLELNHNGQVGLADLWGNIIIEPCADSILLLEKTFRIKHKNEERYSIYQIPSENAIEYVGLCKNNLYKLIYKNKIISDFIYSSFEIIAKYTYSEYFFEKKSYDNIFNDEEFIFIKAKIEDKFVLYYKGIKLTSNYKDFSISISTFGNKEQYNPFVIIATEHNGYKGVLDNKGNILINFSDQDIIAYRNYLICDTIFFTKPNHPIFDCKDYKLIDRKIGINNECLCCFYKENEYIVIDENGAIYRFCEGKEINSKIFRVSSKKYSFNENKLKFELTDIVDMYEEYDDEISKNKYGGYEGFSDESIDEAFDGDPENYWNID